MNTIPRLVGDELRNGNDVPSGDSIESNRQVILIVDRYNNLDNNREIRRIFPSQIPAWIKCIILAQRNPGTSDVRAASVSVSAGTRGVADNGTSGPGDAFPIGAVWIASIPETLPSTGNPYQPPTRIWILTSSTAVEHPGESGGAGTWIEVAVPDLIENHHSSRAQTFNFGGQSLNGFGSAIQLGSTEGKAFVRNATVMVHESMTANKRVPYSGNWYVEYYSSGGEFAYQHAVLIGQPGVHIYRTAANGSWTDWSFTTAEWK